MCADTPVATVNASITPIDVSTVNRYTRLMETVYIYHDRERTLDINAVDHLWHEGLFQPVNRKRAGQGIVKHDVWGRFVLSNSSSQPVTVVLEYPDHALAHIELYQQVGEGLFQSLGQQSYFRPYVDRSVEHSRYSFRVTVPALTQQTFYLFWGVENAGTIYADMRVWKDRAFERFHSSELYAYGIFTGYLTLVAILSFVFYLATRNKGLLYYVGFVVSNIIAWGFIFGFLPEMFLREGSHWRYMVIGGAASISFAALFTQHVLRTRRFLPRLNYWIKGLAWFGLFPIVCAIFNWSLPALLGVEINLLGMLLLAAAGVIRARQGEPIAIAFSLSWACYCAGMVIFPFRDFAIIDHTPLTYWLTPVGALFEVSLLFTTISVLIRRGEQAKQKARKNYVCALEHQRFLLEATVRERTQALQSAKEMAEREARTDSLTQLANRRLFMERFSEELSRCQRLGNPLSLLLFDIDHFKAINDQYGHEAGDRVLTALGQQIRSHIREYDLLARIGGEEFALLMPNARLEEAKALSERILGEVTAASAALSGLPIEISFTGGVVEASPGDEPTKLLSRADDLLYRGKNAGRNRICSAEPDTTSA
ncbi:diguanylate cyclase [Halioxenophilus sp. WMMB6]|uniref:sensor domain-containing diguanylate cyclase n=1 Tax=Halioxenophilus sp. WMMB6 TaxID=3073815 RepID=UPI00295F324B|nr:diguanylate cyclase [Halioxenophilus sp. WMMB6]